MPINRRRPTLREFSMGMLVVVLLAIIGWLLVSRHAPTPVPRNEVSVPAALAPEVKRETTVATPIKSGTVQTYRPAAKANLKLPDSVVGDVTKSVIAASQVKANDRPQTVITVANTETGAFETYVKEGPEPWLAWDTRGEAGLYLGLKNGEKAARLEVRQGVAAIKAAHLGLIVSADQPLTGPLRADYFVGAGVWMRW